MISYSIFLTLVLFNEFKGIEFENWRVNMAKQNTRSLMSLFII